MKPHTLAEKFRDDDAKRNLPNPEPVTRADVQTLDELERLEKAATPVNDKS